MTPPEIQEYNTAASQHEHLVEKYCNLLGTTLAGVVCYEDRVALNYLLSRPEVDLQNVGCLGLSGGGNRSALLLATHEGIQAAGHHRADEHLRRSAGPQCVQPYLDAVPARLGAPRGLAGHRRLPRPPALACPV